MKKFEYMCVKIEERVEDTEEMLNEFAQKGWRLVCSYAQYTKYLILEREVKK